MSKLTPQQYQDKYARRLKAATADITQGIANVTVAPTSLAAAKSDKMLANLTASVQSGRWANALNKVTLQQWKDQATNVGVNRIAAGVDAAKQKSIDFATQLLPAVDAAVAKIQGMPDLTVEDNINRMTTYIRQMATFHKT
jgi:hypothetical protein